jgi:glutamine synthetase type III
MFLQEGPHGTMILYIPSVFISYNGEALDEKSVLLRSSSIISKVALEILHLIEPVEEGKLYNFITINNNNQFIIGYNFFLMINKSDTKKL